MLTQEQIDVLTYEEKIENILFLIEELQESMTQSDNEMAALKEENRRLRDDNIMLKQALNASENFAKSLIDSNYSECSR